jgi:hypothetical protein
MSASTTENADGTYYSYIFYRYYYSSQWADKAGAGPTLYPDEASCIPPITASNQCPLDYNFGPCPSGFDGVSTIIQSGTSAAIGCPHMRFESPTSPGELEY